MENIVRPDQMYLQRHNAHLVHIFEHILKDFVVWRAYLSIHCEILWFNLPATEAWPNVTAVLCKSK